MLAWLLAKNIASLFFIMLVGFVLVKIGLLKESDSKPISVLLVYILAPVMAIVSFEVEVNAELVYGLLLSFAAAFCMQSFSLILVKLMAKPCKLSTLEQGSCIYSNCVNLVIPLAVATLGSEWAIFSLTYMAVSACFMFTHGDMLISGNKFSGIKSIITNPNLVAIAIGLVLFITGLRLPGPVDDAARGLSNMLGPASMLVAGMSIGAAKLKDVVANRRVWLVTAIRLIIIPLIICFLLKTIDLSWLVPDAHNILLVTLLANSAPCATMMVQFSILYNKDSVYASAINVVSTLCCIVTMPLILALYQL